MDEILTAEQAAEYLQLSIHTLASWRRPTSKATLPFIEVGGSIRYRKADIDSWLSKRTVNGPEET